MAPQSEALETEILGADAEALAKACARSTAEAVFARRAFDQAAQQLKDQQAENMRATTAALDSLQRQAGAQWKKHSDLVERVRALEHVGSGCVQELVRLRSDHGVLSGSVADLTGEVLSLRADVGVPGDPEAVRKSINETTSPEQIEKLQQGTGLFRESYRNRAHRHLTAKRLALFAVLAYVLQTAIVVGVLLLKG